MLEISSLSKNYGKMRGVHNVSFTVEKGEIVGFIGPNVPRYEQKTLPIT